MLEGNALKALAKNKGKGCVTDLSRVHAVASGSADNDAKHDFPEMKTVPFKEIL